MGLERDRELLFRQVSLPNGCAFICQAGGHGHEKAGAFWGAVGGQLQGTDHRTGLSGGDTALSQPRRGRIMGEGEESDRDRHVGGMMGRGRRDRV